MSQDRPFHRPDQRWRVDGMCAAYACLNSIKVLFETSEKQDDALFAHMCKTNASMFPRIVYEGVGVRGMRSLLHSCESWVDANYPGYQLKIGSPYARKNYPHIGVYFESLRTQNVVHGSDRQTWIVHLSKPCSHWTCIREINERAIRFYDSYGMRRYKISSFTLDANAIQGDTGLPIVIDARHTFRVERIASKSAPRTLGNVEP